MICLGLYSEENIHNGLFIKFNKLEAKFTKKNFVKIILVLEERTFSM